MNRLKLIADAITKPFQPPVGLPAVDSDVTSQNAAFHSGMEPDKSAALDLDSWRPINQSADRSIIPSKDMLEGRVIDMLENDGYMAGAVDHHLNHTIGTGLRLNLQPNYKAIGATEEWAIEFADWAESGFKSYAWSHQNHIDYKRQFNWGTLQTQAERSFLAHGEILASIESKPSRGKYRTCVNIIDPARLSTPSDTTLTQNKDIRGGVEMDSSGAPIAYWISNIHPAPFASRVKRREQITWTRYEMFSKRGRRKIIHLFDPQRPEQCRGYTIFAPIVRAMKMVDRVSDATLSAALMQTLFAVVIKSDLNLDDAMNVLGADNNEDGMGIIREYMEQRGEYYSKHSVSVDGVKAVHLLPNEDLELKSPDSTSQDIGAFFDAMRQEAARGSGMSMENFTGDYSRASYSSSRMSNIENNRGHTGRRSRVNIPFAQHVFSAVLEEMLILNPEVLPRNVSFKTDQDAITQAEWIGPPLIDADPKKTAEATAIDLKSGVASIKQIAAEKGMDWRDLLRDQAQVLTEKKRLGLFGLEEEQALALKPMPPKQDVSKVDTKKKKVKEDGK